MRDRQWRRVEEDIDLPDQPTREDHEDRLSALEDLEMDFPTRDELYDYLEWLAQEFDVDISDMYRMYFGYDLAAE